MRTFAVLLAICFSASPAIAQIGSSAPNDPVLGARLVEGVATADQLWLRNEAGAVVVFDRADANRRIIVEEGAADLLRDAGRTLVLQSDGGTPRRFSVQEPETGRSLTPPLQADALGFLREGLDWIVITKDALYRSDGGEWRRQPFEGFGRHFGVMTLASTPDGSIYILVSIKANGAADFGGLLQAPQGWLKSARSMMIPVTVHLRLNVIRSQVWRQTLIMPDVYWPRLVYPTCCHTAASCVSAAMKQP